MIKLYNIIPIPNADGIIVGIINSEYSCLCNDHPCCSEYLIRVRSIISFAPDRIFVEGVKENIIKVLCEGCHVGWIPRTDINMFFDKVKGRKAIVIGLLNNKEVYSAYIRRIYHCNYGAGVFEFVA